VSGEQYFTASPSSDARPRLIRVPLAGTTYELQTAAGTFSPDRLDAGTAVLLDSVPAPPESGALLDLGCGWGPVALTLALRSPGADVWAVDVNERSLALTTENASRVGVSVTASYPKDTPEDLRFAAIWSNPPIRIGKSALHDLLDAWLPRLAPGGSAWLVVARSLGADSLEQWMAPRFAPIGCTVWRRRLDRGYRVLEVARSGNATVPE
jgi:16S rRNA (guanine1207-N2)-methyltransferase